MKQSPVQADAKVGLCISTFAAVPYVHLNLECLRRHEPNVKVLIHDDSSPQFPALLSLAGKYDADIVSTDFRKVPTVGDLSGFVEALRWGRQQGLDVVVKCSRRFILNKPWSVGLVELMHNTQYATACAPCSHFGFGFRSEFVAMHVGSWIASGAFAQMEQAVRENKSYDSLPEAYDHHRARDVHRFVHPPDDSVSFAGNTTTPECDYLVRSERTFKRPDEYAAFAWWTNVMGLTRMQRMPGILWHDSHGSPEYYQLAQEFGLPYCPEEFVVIPGS